MRWIPGSYRHDTVTPLLSWSGTIAAGTPPKYVEGPRVAPDPVGHLLRQRRLRVREVRRAEHRDEELDLDPLARLRRSTMRGFFPE